MHACWRPRERCVRRARGSSESGATEHRAAKARADHPGSQTRVSFATTSGDDPLARLEDGAGDDILEAGASRNRVVVGLDDCSPRCGKEGTS